MVENQDDLELMEEAGGVVGQGCRGLRSEAEQPRDGYRRGVVATAVQGFCNPRITQARRAERV